MSNEDNQLNLNIDDNEIWLDKVNVVDMDDFIGYNETMDQKRFAAFDFSNQKVYVASDDLIEDHDINFKDFQQNFVGLTCVRQQTTENLALDVEENTKAFENAQKSYIAKQMNNNSSEIKKNQKSLDQELDSVEDDSVAPRNRSRLTP